MFSRRVIVDAVIIMQTPKKEFLVVDNLVFHAGKKSSQAASRFLP